jgi:hypothetical protein
MNANAFGLRVVSSAMPVPRTDWHKLPLIRFHAGGFAEFAGDWMAG